MQILRTVIVTILIAATASLAVASPSMTFGSKPDQPTYRWRPGTIRLLVSSSLMKANANIKSESDVLGALRRSVRSWQDAANIEFQVEMTDKQTVSPAGAAGDGVTLITIASTPENVLFFAKDAQAVSAKTRVFYNRKGYITEADIALNPFQQFSTDGSFGTFDLESVFTHEIGHLLGLRHSGVMGAAMSDNLGKNGAIEQSQFHSRGLSDSDVAAVREIYGSPSEDEDCCAAVTGKLTLQNGRAGKNVKVWAEDTATGRVVAQAETASDGTYRIGGLAGGKYELYWRAKSGSAGVATGDLGDVELEPRESTTVNQKISLESTRLSIDLIGADGHLGESALALEAGSVRTIFIGGRGLTAESLNLTVTSKFLHIDPASIAERDFGEGVSVVSFALTVDEEAPAGVYSIFASFASGGKTSLVGAIRVE